MRTQTHPSRCAQPRFNGESEEEEGGGKWLLTDFHALQGRVALAVTSAGDIGGGGV